MRWLVVVLLAFFSSWLGMIGGGGFPQRMFAVVVTVFLFLPFLILTGFSVGKKRKTNGFCHVLRSGPGGLMCFGSLVVGFGVSSFAIIPYREHRAKAFVADTIPLLDVYFKTHGKYPDRLEEVGRRELPVYFQKNGSYRSDGQSFHFYYETPDSLMGGMVLSNTHRSWSVAD